MKWEEFISTVDCPHFIVCVLAAPHAVVWRFFFFLFLVQSNFRMQFAQGLHNTECWLIKQIHTEHTHVAATNPPVHCLNQITFFSYLTWFLDRYHRCTMCGWAYLAQYSLIIEHTQGADQTWCRVRHEFYFPWHSLKTNFIKKKKNNTKTKQ